MKSFSHSRDARLSITVFLHVPVSRGDDDPQGQLLWKEFNYFSGYTIPNFDKMVGNPVAR